MAMESDLRRWIRLCEAMMPDWLTGDVYHGTARNGLEFHSNRVAYFTSNFKSAREHALMDANVDGGTPRVIKATLSVKRPVRIDTYEMQDLHFKPDVVKALEAQGHDCAIGDYEGEVAIFGDRNIHVQEIIDVGGSSHDEQT
jgi:hypothetical protein